LLCLLNENWAEYQVEPDDTFICTVVWGHDGWLFAERTGYIAPTWNKMIEELAKDSSIYNYITEQELKK